MKHGWQVGFGAPVEMRKRTRTVPALDTAIKGLLIGGRTFSAV